MTVRRIAVEDLDQLSQAAATSSRKRQHCNVHVSYDDPCQRLFNAVAPDSYIRPHRHSIDPKSEFLLAVRGTFWLVGFDDSGLVSQVEGFGESAGATATGICVAVEIPPGMWHMVISNDPGGILFEAKAGPFDPVAAKEFALWAPEEGTREAAEYLHSIREQIRCWPRR